MILWLLSFSLWLAAPAEGVAQRSLPETGLGGLAEEQLFVYDYINTAQLVRDIQLTVSASVSTSFTDT